jgi:hypothetical protein
MKNYTVSIVLKDSNGVLKQLDNLEKGGATSSANKASGTSGGGVFSKLQNLGIGQLAKLAGIGLGIGELVNLTVKSSGILQGTFKLWETSMMLIFKPFGDFVGMALRPLTLMMLMWAIPFYKVAGPFFRDYGAQLGLALAGKGYAEGGVLGNINPSAEKTAELTIPGYTALKKLGDLMAPTFDKLIVDLGVSLGNVPATIFNVFANTGVMLSSWLANIPKVFSDVFLNTGVQLSSWLANIPGTIADVFVGLANNLTTALASIPQKIFDAIMAWITKLASGNSITEGRSPNGWASGRWNTRSQAIADTNP